MSDTDKAAAWHAFLAAIEEWATVDQGDLAEKRKLADAASAYAASRGGAAPASRPQPTTSGGAVFKFGRSKGAPLAGAQKSDLEWYAGALRRSIAEPEKARFLASNEAELAQVEAELAR